LLPAELLVARVRRGRLHPLFLRMAEEELYVAEELLRIFGEHVGRRRGELEASLERLEEAAFRLGVHYKVVRGLAHLLLRRAAFSRPIQGVDPVRVRLEVFRRAGALGAALTEGERRSVLRDAARALGLSEEDVERALAAVHEEEQVLESFQPVSPEQLIREYNLSVAQTALFRALSVTVSLEASGTEVKHLLRWVKRLGLMYTASRQGRELVLELEGPASLLRQTERYGTRLAKLLPLVIGAGRWRVSARVKARRGPVLFELDSGSAPPLPEPAPPEAVEFDSSLEREFYRSFLALGSGWEILREPEPLVVGSSVFIPDFAFERGGRRVYMEIVGFWTPSYLRRKLEKLRALRDVAMIVAVDEEGACAHGFSELPHTVITFRRKIPIDRVYRLLKALEPPAAAQPSGSTRAPPPEALKLLEEVVEEPLQKVLERLSSLGLSEEECYSAIATAGLRIEWRGLDPSRAVVRRAPGSGRTAEEGG
jgi:predicted nuclease of restriction endonuclease-like RecB superfamily